MTAMIVTKSPNECSASELQDFAALVLAGGEVTAAGLDARIKKAERLIFVVENNCLKGIAALKNPEVNYKDGVFKKAHATVEAKHFPLELGWVFVLPSARGAGLSRKLVEAALASTYGQAVFATSRSDNAPMHKVLRANGFSCHGKTYASTRGNQQLALFLRNAAQQGTPGDAPEPARP
jgi:GNAT superfamily N-acetyltransferase